MPKRAVVLALLASALLSTSTLAETQYIFRTEPGLREAAEEAPSFAPASQPVVLQGEVGASVSSRLGSYTGAGWSCDTVASAAWLSCSFAGGVATISGTSSATSNGTADVTLRNGSSSSVVRLSLDIRSAVGFTASGNPVLVDGEANKPLSTLLGTRSGGSVWSCGPVAGLEWASCRLGAGGVIDLVGSPSRVLTGNYLVPVYESGAIVANVPANVRIVDGTPSATFDVTALGGRDRIAQPNQPFSFPLATYQSSDDGWTCRAASGTISPWLSCQFSEGTFSLAGQAGDDKTASATARYAISKGGRDYGGSTQAIQVRSVSRIVTGGAETTTNPRSATFSAAPLLERVFSPGQEMDIDVGELAGGPEGFSCFSNGLGLFDGSACHVVDGRVRLRGVAPSARATRSFQIVPVKDGIALGSTNSATYAIEERIVTGGPEWSSAPRSATFVARLNPDHRATRVFKPGETVDIEVGSMTGGPEGVSCYNTSINLFWPGFACHEAGGKLFLRGTTPSGRTGRTGFIYVVKDTVRIGSIGQSTFKTEPRIVTGGDETPNSPRGGSFTPAAVSNVSFRAGTPVDVLLGKLDVTEAAGVSCYMTSREMPSGLACHNEGGDIRLRGMAPSTGSFTNRIAIVRDTVELGQTNQFTITFTN